MKGMDIKKGLARIHGNTECTVRIVAIFLLIAAVCAVGWWIEAIGVIQGDSQNNLPPVQFALFGGLVGALTTLVSDLFIMLFKRSEITQSSRYNRKTCKIHIALEQRCGCYELTFRLTSFIFRKDTGSEIYFPDHIVEPPRDTRNILSFYYSYKLDGHEKISERWNTSKGWDTSESSRKNRVLSPQELVSDITAECLNISYKLEEPGDFEDDHRFGSIVYGPLVIDDDISSNLSNYKLEVSALIDDWHKNPKPKPRKYIFQNDFFSQQGIRWSIRKE